MIGEFSVITIVNNRTFLQYYNGSGINDKDRTIKVYEIVVNECVIRKRTKNVETLNKSKKKKEKNMQKVIDKGARF